MRRWATRAGGVLQIDNSQCSETIDNTEHSNVWCQATGGPDVHVMTTG